MERPSSFSCHPPLCDRVILDRALWHDKHLLDHATSPPDLAIYSIMACQVEERSGTMPR